MAAIGAAAPVARIEQRLWHTAFAYLALLGAFFYASYGVANWAASQRAFVPSAAFGWERGIPFLAWTIVPYWSLNLFYCGSLFVCRTRAELDRHALRLLAAQMISVAAFLVIPLRYSFAPPETHGFFGWMFDALMSFDKPFNQAPSLHLSIAVIVAARYSAHMQGLPRRVLQALFALIGLSALTTYQHHFIDVPTGVWVGALCCALFPEEALATDRQDPQFKRAAFYGAGFAALAALAIWRGSWALWLLWPAGACLIVAGIYASGQPGLFRKRRGSLDPAMRWLLAPYLAAAWLNTRWWTRGESPANEIAPGVWVGRFPRSEELSRFASVVDLTAELAMPAAEVHYANVPVLDLTVPSAEQLDRAVASIEDSPRPMLICCALGYSRSATAAAAWLTATGRAPTVDAAIAMIAERRPRVVLTAAHRARLEEWTGGGRDDTSWFARAASQALVLVTRLVAGVEVRRMGSAGTPTQKVFVANHTSHADFLALWAALPAQVRSRTRPVAAADYWTRGSVRRYLAERVFRAVLIDRESATLEPVREALRRGESLIFFPEGTRGSGEGLLPFKCGLYHIARAFPDVDLVPVWIHNLHRIFPKGAVIPAPLLCSIAFGEPTRMTVGERKAEFLARLREVLGATSALC